MNLIKIYNNYIFWESIYKNYMQLPPENKRERHIIIKLELD